MNNCTGAIEWLNYATGFIACMAVCVVYKTLNLWIEMRAKKLARQMREDQSK